MVIEGRWEFDVAFFLKQLLEVDDFLMRKSDTSRLARTAAQLQGLSAT